MQEYFQNMVNVTVDTSIKHVRAYVHAYLSDNIKTARDKISGYGSMYSDIMHRALEIKTHSESAGPVGAQTSWQSRHCHVYADHPAELGHALYQLHLAGSEGLGTQAMFCSAASQSLNMIGFQGYKNFSRLIVCDLILPSEVSTLLIEGGVQALTSRTLA